MNNTNTIPIVSDDNLYPVLVQCFFIMGAGYVAGQLNLLSNTHSIGLSRYISNFALPAVIFKNLVEVNFQNVSWQFLSSVLISKAIVFFLTIILTYVGERPKNFASMGQYAIMATQSSDFPIMLPIIEAVYKQSHPEYSRYIYLIAPISLVILNPIGFVLIEIQKRFDEQRKHRHKSWRYYQIIASVIYNISRNPIVISTVAGVIFNQILKQHLPFIIDYVLTPIAQSFIGTALFYLGLTMVGKLNRLHAHLVIVVFLLSIMKLIIFPLILRQAVFFLVKPVPMNLNVTMDFSNFGFLYGTAPTAATVVFYVPESYLALQAISSTELVISTLLSGPIILFSAKMLTLRTVDFKITQAYEMLLTKTAFDVSILSLFCTSIVLTGFCLRQRWFKTSAIHTYTFIFVGLQMILAIWTIGTHFIAYPLTATTSIIVDIGHIFLALATRTWATSLSIALMITICYSNQSVHRYAWISHVFGWILPICVSSIIYFYSSIDRSKQISILGIEKFGKIQIILSIIVLVLCIVINTINLLRITRRTYRSNHEPVNRHSCSTNDNNSNVNLAANEVRPLINEDDDHQIDRQLISKQENTSTGADSQLFRHGILVALLNIDAIICVAILFWLLLAHNRDGIYYELQLIDTVLLYGQGIISFLVFALDADLLVPISKKIIKLFYCFGFNFKCLRERGVNRSSENDDSLALQIKIRSEFIRDINMTHPNETIFQGNQFCQWLITNEYVENEFTAQNYFQQMIDKGYVICINQTRNQVISEPISNWYAFSK